MHDPVSARRPRPARSAARSAARFVVRASFAITAAALAARGASAQQMSSTLFNNLPSPIGVALGDFNGDGRCDSATIHQSSGGNPAFVNLMLGDGLGALLPPTTFQCQTPSGAGIVAGDWNGDSKLDV